MADPISFTDRCFRVVPPAWAHDPLSGAGAQRHGGRFNARGIPAFDCALDPHTAYAEYTSALYDRPGLLVALSISNASILDLTNPEHLARTGLVDADLKSSWKEPSPTTTQRLSQSLTANGIDGLIYASLQHPQGRNLVLWRWNGRPRLKLLDRFGEAITTPIGNERTS